MKVISGMYTRLNIIAHACIRVVLKFAVPCYGFLSVFCFHNLYSDLQFCEYLKPVASQLKLLIIAAMGTCSIAAYFHTEAFSVQKLQ